MNGKKLNLKWVSEIIGEDYKLWNKGDIVTINAQTGTGKTFFITGNKDDKGLIDRIGNRSLIYICNRVELKRQVKLDLLKKFDELYKIEADKDSENVKPIEYENEEYIVDYDKLDNLDKVKNVTVTAYHNIANRELDNIYHGQDNNLHNFDYIVCDECHFFLTDADFNNKTELVFFNNIREYYPNSIRIFISATMGEIYPTIEAAYENIKENEDENIKLWNKYTTGIDYSYCNVKYFAYIEDIYNLIKNDNTGEKWLIFVKSKDDGKMLKSKLESNNISCEFIYAGSKSEERKNISIESRFKCKVLITTKCLDNGVNINDENVRNLVINAFDKTTFIQELGRVRINIKDARQVNLFIPTFRINNFQGKLRLFERKKKQVDLFEKDIDKFKRDYEIENWKIYNDLIYLQNGEWKYNHAGNCRLRKDMKFTYKMLALFKGGIELEDGSIHLINDGFKDKFAFIKEQLDWIGLRANFNEDNLIESVFDEEIKMDLNNYMEKLFNDRIVFLTAKDRRPIIEGIGLIDKHNSNIGVKKNKPIKINYIKNIETLNSHLIENLALEYRIKKFETSRTIGGKKKKFKSAWKIEKIISY
ncbi:DEAD/DEAH box helicase family protein [Paeniclostridium sordellii]|uniref:DEAD/DEAH box helicase family protein n=1 Tax=Paraclostridium sordellii TaxID=1505 RepID=UPI00214A342F|nr:DEAD/DEAH box helicase family protein [Paeniclostridium sordellii]MCR1848274.1 DEAD/DEAH box helicase family protein [Paeniclostridium sordellii]